MISFNVRTRMLISALAFACLSSLTSFGAHASDEACRVTVESNRTAFPANAQRLGHFGTVRVAVQVDASGRAERANVEDSSGHATLDRAAVDSVLKHWEFGVANCTAQDLAQLQTVDVVFHRAKSLTLSTSVNREAIAEVARLRASENCDVRRISSDTTIASCIRERNTEDEIVADANRQTRPTR